VVSSAEISELQDEEGFLALLENAIERGN
jgi:hypothetical protein